MALSQPEDIYLDTTAIRQGNALAGWVVLYLDGDGFGGYEPCAASELYATQREAMERAAGIAPSRKPTVKALRAGPFVPGPGGSTHTNQRGNHAEGTR